MRLPPGLGRACAAGLWRALRRAAKAAAGAKNADRKGTNKQRTRARTSSSLRARYNVSRKTHSQVTWTSCATEPNEFCLFSST
jgi:hypothetical protein